MALGEKPDTRGRVIRVRGVRTGLKKVYGEEYKIIKSTSGASVNTSQTVESLRSSLTAQIREQVMNEVGGIFNALLNHLGISPEELHKNTHAQPFKVSTLDPPPIPEIKEETPCKLLLPGRVYGKLIVLANGSVLPQTESLKVHFLPVSAGCFGVSLLDIVAGLKISTCWVMSLVASFVGRVYM